MKKLARTALSLLLSCSILFGSGVSAFATEATPQEQLDTAIEELLELAKTRGSEQYDEEEKEAFEILAEEDSSISAYCISNPSYTAAENSFYVSLGDSTVTGMGLEGYSNYGYKVRTPGAYPSLITKKLNLDFENQYQQLACGGLRTEDIRFILDDTFVGDEYTQTVITNSLNSHAGSVENARKDYDEYLAKADLVTITMGGNNVGTFLGTQINRAAEGLEPYDMNWESYFDENGRNVLHGALNLIESILSEAGLEERDINTVLVALEGVIYGYVGFACNFAETINDVHEHSPNALVAIVGLYNSIEGVYLDLGSIRIDIGGIIGKFVDFANAHFKIYASITDNTVLVNVPDVETFAEADAVDGSVDFSLPNFIGYMTGNSGLATHPSGNGHAYIAEKVFSTIDCTPIPDQIEEPDVDKPNTDQPDIDEPGVDQPDIDEPDTDQPGIDEPDTDQPGIDEPDTDQPGIDEPDTNQPGIDEPDTEKPGQNQPDTNKPNGKPAANSCFGFLKNIIKGFSSIICNFKPVIKFPIFSWFRK